MRRTQISHHLNKLGIPTITHLFSDSQSLFMSIKNRICHQSAVAHTSAKTFPSGRNGSVRVDALRESRQRHPGGGLLRARRQDHASRHLSACDRHFVVSSRSVSLLFQTNTLALWPTVTIRQNGFIGYTLASGLHCNG